MLTGSVLLTNFETQVLDLFSRWLIRVFWSPSTASIALWAKSYGARLEVGRSGLEIAPRH